MENHFEICMTEDQLRGTSSIGLAHMGDAVFELLVRGWLCQHGKATGKGLHQATIQLVRAEHQAACAEKILFGWLYLGGQRQRASDLFDVMMEE